MENYYKKYLKYKNKYLHLKGGMEETLCVGKDADGSPISIVVSLLSGETSVLCVARTDEKAALIKQVQTAFPALPPHGKLEIYRNDGTVLESVLDLNDGEELSEINIQYDYFRIRIIKKTQHLIFCLRSWVSNPYEEEINLPNKFDSEIAAIEHVNKQLLEHEDAWATKYFPEEQDGTSRQIIRIEIIGVNGDCKDEIVRTFFK